MATPDEIRTAVLAMTPQELSTLLWGENGDLGLHPITEALIVNTKLASDDAATTVILAPVCDDGRSEWRWFWTSAGDLILGCYPAGDTYFATEEDHSA